MNQNILDAIDFIYTKWSHIRPVISGKVALMLNGDLDQSTEVTEIDVKFLNASEDDLLLVGCYRFKFKNEYNLKLDILTKSYDEIQDIVISHKLNVSNGKEIDIETLSTKTILAYKQRLVNLGINSEKHQSDIDTIQNNIQNNTQNN